MKTNPSPHDKSPAAGRRKPGPPYHTVEQLTQENVDTVLHLEALAKTKSTFADRFANHVTFFCGSHPGSL